MKNFDELNNYEILDIPINASEFEIRQAYKEALSIYDNDSLATYSLFTDEERSNVLKKIEEAFYTLIDENTRADYDNMLVKSGKIEASSLNKQDRRKPIPLFKTRISIDESSFLKRVRGKVEEKEVQEISNQILLKDVIWGKDLKKLRKSLGIELEEIFEVARISLSILRAIEENQTESLPSTIYLKNFLKLYAEILQLDSERIVDGYLKSIHPFQKTS